jgi:hypothetical protein
MAVLLAANKEFNKIIRTDKKEDAKIVWEQILTMLKLLGISI